MVAKKIVKKEKKIPQKSLDKIDYTIKELECEIQDFRTEEVFVCIQDCVKKIKGMKFDNGY